MSKKRGTQTATTPEQLIEAAHSCEQRINNLYLFEDGWHAKVNDGRPSGCDAEKSMAITERRAVTVLLTEGHLRKMIEDHLLKEDEVGDRVTARPRLNFCTRYNGFSREACIDGVSGPPGSAVERVTIDPLDLQVAQDQEVAM